MWWSLSGNELLEAASIIHTLQEHALPLLLEMRLNEGWPYLGSVLLICHRVAVCSRCPILAICFSSTCVLRGGDRCCSEDKPTPRTITQSLHAIGWPFLQSRVFAAVIALVDLTRLQNYFSGRQAHVIAPVMNDAKFSCIIHINYTLNLENVSLFLSCSISVGKMVFFSKADSWRCCAPFTQIFS